MKIRHDERKGLGFMKRINIVLAIMIAVVSLTSMPQKASAQEILLEGPLAGAPAVRELVQYRKLRVSLGPQLGYTILNDYMHNFMLGARLEFNVLDWLSIGGVAYFALNVPTKLTNHITDSKDIGGEGTTPAESNWPSYTGADHFEKQVALLKGMYLGQISLIPFRGKMALFEKLFVAIDAYIFAGAGVVRFEQRKACSGDPTASNACGVWNDASTWTPKKESRVKAAFTGGIGVMTYLNDWLAINIEYRITPFKWNAGGTDEAGQAGTEWALTDSNDGTIGWDASSKGKDGDYPDGNIDDQDMSLNMNQSIALGVIFHLPLTPRIAD